MGEHGADPAPAMAIAEERYGRYSEQECWEAWHVVAMSAGRAVARVVTLEVLALQAEGSAEVRCMNAAGETLQTMSALPGQTVASLRKSLSDALGVHPALVQL